MPSLSLHIPLVALGLAACLAAAPASVHAAEPAPAVVASHPSPLRAEIAQHQQTTRAAIQELSATLSEATGQEQILAIQREISRLKAESRVQTLRIQLRHAEAAGRTDAAARLRDAIDKLTTPRQPAVPVRPLPSRTGN